MRRRLFTVASGLSVLLCLATAASWVRGAWTRNRPVDRLIFTFPGRRLWELTTYHGQISIVTVRDWPNREPTTFFTAPLSKFVGDFMAWDCPQFILKPTTQRDWHDFEWDTGIAYTELFKGRAFWCRKIWWVDVPPPLSGPMELRALYFPHWSLVLAAALLPLFHISIGAVSLARSRARRNNGRCATCGYNLSGNTSGVCPECGTAVSREAETAA